MRDRELAIFALAGLGVWLNGAVAFRLGGPALFGHGPWVTALVAAVVAALVCGVLRAAMAWRKTDARQAVTVAVIMALPGLFGEAARQTAFSWATGLAAGQAPAFAAVIFFGNAALLTYAVAIARGARA